MLNYSTINLKNEPEFKLNPYWVTGFADAESSFGVVVSKNKQLKIGWNVGISFSIQ